FTTSATDVLDGAIATTCTPASGSTFAFGPTTVSCTATDAHGNHSTASFTVTVHDTTGPVVTVPANATVEATSAAGAAYTFVASATDALDGALATTCVPASGSAFPFGATTVSCTATDAHGNHSSASFTVTVLDTHAPVVTAPPPLTIAATQAEGARGNVMTAQASAAVRAFLASDTAVDGAGAATRQAPQVVINGELLEATTETLFTVGTSTVTF